MAGIPNAVESSKSSWFDSAMSGLGSITSLGLGIFKGYEEIQSAKDSAQIKNSMSQAEGQTNLAIAQMNASNQRMLNTILIFGGIGLAFILVSKMFK